MSTPDRAADRPIGFDAAAEDWNDQLNGRPMGLGDWNSLTFGEQARYGARECRTKGAMFKSRVSAGEVSMAVTLPSNLALTGLTEKEAKWLEAALHRKFEETLHWIIVGRQNGWKP